MKKLAQICLLLGALVLPTQVAAQNRADTMLIPTRVVIKAEERYATLVLKNTGTASGQYEISLVEMRMTEDGAITEIPEGEPADYPASAFVHMAPRSVTVAPGASQVIRILVRRPEGQEAGEYRSHIKVRVVNENVEGGAAAPAPGTIEVKANLVLVIPLIVRTGEGSGTIKLSDLQIGKTEAENFIDMNLNREGNISVMGDIKILQNGKEIAQLDGVPVYRPTAKRKVRVSLGKTPVSGSLTVRYQLQQAQGGTLLDEKSVTP
jgi:fimbrial chaperone protein